MERGRRKASQKPRRMNREEGDVVTIFRKPTLQTEQLNRECNTREQEHQVNYLTNSSKLAGV